MIIRIYAQVLWASLSPPFVCPFSSFNSQWQDHIQAYPLPSHGLMSVTGVFRGDIDAVIMSRVYDESEYEG